MTGTCITQYGATPRTYILWERELGLRPVTHALSVFPRDVSGIRVDERGEVAPQRELERGDERGGVDRGEGVVVSPRPLTENAPPSGGIPRIRRRVPFGREAHPPQAHGPSAHVGVEVEVGEVVPHGAANLDDDGAYTRNDRAHTYT